MEGVSGCLFLLKGQTQTEASRLSSNANILCQLYSLLFLFIRTGTPTLNSEAPRNGLKISDGSVYKRQIYTCAFIWMCIKQSHEMIAKCGVGAVKLCTAPSCYKCLSASVPELSPIIYKVNINQ